MTTPTTPIAFNGERAEDRDVFIPSMLGLSKGFMAPSASNGVCNGGYGNGQSPFRHGACHDPRRYAYFQIDATVAATSGRVTIAATGENSPIELFGYGVGEPDPDAFEDFALRTVADTNVDKGGFLIPPGFEGLISAIGFAPVCMAPAGANLGTWTESVVSPLHYEAGWKKIFTGAAASLEYWETTTKAERTIGALERWPIGDSMDHAYLSTNGARGSFSRLNPLQFQVPTLGPEERRGDLLADRFKVRIRIPREIQFALPPGGTIVADGNYIFIVRCEIAVGLMLDSAQTVDVRQESKIEAQEAKIASLEAKIERLMSGGR